MIIKNDFDNYFFNGVYDDNIIGDSLSDYQRNLYEIILRDKNWIQNNRVINGDVYDIRMNQDLNARFNMPLHAYSIFLDINIIPFYSEREFFYKYGYGNPISTMDIINDEKIFGKYVYFFINNYLVHNVQFVVLKGGFTILFICPTEDGSASDITMDDLQAIAADPDGDLIWTLLFSTRSDYYMTKKPRALLFEDNKIYLSSFNTYRNYRKPVQNNCWTMYMTSKANSYNVMSTTNVIIEKDEKGEYFLVPEDFKNFIYERANMINCMVFNEPECSGSGIYVNLAESTPVFQIPFDKNPISIRNLLIWHYDSATGRKFHPIEPNVTLYYPNVFDFSDMITESYYVFLCDKAKEYIVDSHGIYIVFDERDGLENFQRPDLYIEWIEPKTDIMSYDSYISDYIDLYQNEYSRMIVENDLPEEFSNFNPIKPIYFGAFDYFHSEYYGDYRAWRLSNIIEILKNNPKRYDEFYHQIYYNKKAFLTKAYWYDHNPEIYERAIDDNRAHIAGNNENLVLFRSPHTYVKVYDYQYESLPQDLFIDGKLTLITFSMKVGSLLYVYFKNEYLTEDHPPIQLDIQLINRIEEHRKFKFDYNITPIDMEDLKFTYSHSLSNIVLHDEYGNYISKDDFVFIGQINSAEIQYVNGIKDIVQDLNKILYDKNDFLIVSSAGEYIVLKVEESEHILTDVDCANDILLDNIAIRPKDEVKSKYKRKEINISTTDFYQRKIFRLVEEDMMPYLNDLYKNTVMTKNIEYIMLPANTDLTPPEGVMETYDFVFQNFRGKPEKERFRIFLDGILLDPSHYNLTFMGYNRDAIITFDTIVFGKEVYVEYLGYTDEIICNTEIESLLKTEDNILFISEYLDSPYDPIICKIFINGKRIANNLIHTLGQNNMLVIDYDYEPTDNIKIYKQKLGNDIYGYRDSQFLDITTINDPDFRKYLLDKYVLNKAMD